jgi:hypothetical protein
MKVLISIIFFTFWTVTAFSNPLVCTDFESKVKLTIAEPEGSETSSERRAEFTDARNWNKTLSFVMSGWGLEGWHFSDAYKANYGVISLDVSHAFSIDYADIKISKMDCRNVRIGEPCKIAVERIEAKCTEVQ